MKKLLKLTVLVASLLMSAAYINTLSAEANPFADEVVSNPFDIQFDKDKKCGEGKCGDGKCGEEKKCGEGKCGEEKKCGEGKCGEGKKCGKK